MFGRVFSSAPLCLRCQRCLTQRRPPWITHQTQGWRLSRLQSSAAAPIDHIDGYDLASDNPVLPDNHKQRRRKPFRQRVWRPAPTAELGVENLGKPAEVLILPSRKRRRQHQSEEQDKSPSSEVDKTRLSYQKVQESFAAEQKPVSFEDVRANIEALKKEIGQEGGYLRPETYLRYRELMRNGFTRAQLLRYIAPKPVEASKFQEHTQDVASPDTNLETKREIAEHIMNKIWGYQYEGSDQDLGVSRKLKIHPEQIDLILLDRTDFLERLSRQYGVKIDFYRSVPHIDIFGLANPVNKAHTKLKALKSSMFRRSIEVPPTVLELLSQDVAITEVTTGSSDGRKLPLMSALAQKHKVVLSLKSSLVECTTFDKTKVADIQRDLFVLSRALKKEEGLSTPLVLANPKTLARASIYSSTNLQDLKSGHDKFRLVTGDAGQKSMYLDRITTNGALHSKLDTVIKDLTQIAIGRTERSATSALQRISSRALREVQLEYHVEFGHAYFTAGEEEQHIGDSIFTQPSQIGFERELPLIPQWIEHQKPWRSHANNSAVGSFIRLLFESVEQAPNKTAIEVYLTHQMDKNEHTKSQISIHKIALLLGQHHRYVLLPDSIADLRIVRHERLKIFEQGARPRSQLLPLMAQIGAYLNEAKSHPTDGSNIKFGAMLELDMSPLMKRPSTKQRSMPKPKAESSEKKPTKAELTKYVLESAELVEQSAYFVPSGSAHVLRHLSYDPLDSSLMQNATFVLQIADAPLLGKRFNLNEESGNAKAPISDREGAGTADEDVEIMKADTDHQMTVSPGTTIESNSASRPESQSKMAKKNDGWLRDVLITACDTALKLSEFSRSKTHTVAKQAATSKKISGG